MPRKPRNIRYVLYARVSNDRQDVDNSMSAQEAAAQRFIDANPGQLLRTYRDEAKSGRVEHRPAFQQMIQDAADPDRTFDVVLVWKLSRFARNRKVSITYKALLAELGIRVISISENTGDDPAGRMVEGIIESVDEFHSANMAVDIKNGMRNSVERGFYLARSAPSGYKIVHVKDGSKYRPKLELDPPNDQVPRRVFQLALMDYGLKRIAKTMTDEGYRGVNGGIFNIVKIDRMLKNPHYTGYTFWDYRHNNDNYAKSLEPAHEAIISPEEFETVQQKIASRRSNIIHPRTAAAPHLFNDLGVCAQCGHRIGIKGAHGNKYLYFTCTKRLKYGKEACPMPRFPLTKNDPIILDAIIEDILRPANVRELISHVQSIAPQNHSTPDQKLDHLDAWASSLDNRESQLLIAMEMQTFSNSKIMERMEALNDERAQIERQRQAILAEVDTETAFLSNPDLILAYANDLKTYLRDGTVISANAMLKRFIESLSFENGYVTINYNIPLPDGTPVGQNSRKVALAKRVSPTISVGPPIHPDPDDGPKSPAGTVRHWPPGDGRRRRYQCGRGRCVVALDGCSLFQGGFPYQEPLSPKQGALSHGLTTAPHSSFRWIGVYAKTLVFAQRKRKCRERGHFRPTPRGQHRQHHQQTHDRTEPDPSRTQPQLRHVPLPEIPNRTATVPRHALQAGIPHGHLNKQAIGAGDIFLFFGPYHRVEEADQSRRFVRGARNCTSCRTGSKSTRSVGSLTSGQTTSPRHATIPTSLEATAATSTPYMQLQRSWTSAVATSAQPPDGECSQGSTDAWC